MKRIAVLMMALLLCVGVVACAPEETTAAPTTAAPTTAPAGETTAPTATDEDWAYIMNKGTLVVGITNFAPMDYKDDSGEWIGFDADLSRAFAAELGLEIEFIEIDWDNKILELDSKTIDCVWNGMTLTDEVVAAMQTSNAYCNNAQVLVISADKADDYQTVDSLEGLNIAVEAGSAGEKVVSGLGYTTVPVLSQADALLEVASGTSDACVIDSLMAGAMIGPGTGYEQLTYTVALNSEEYGVGFRTGSDAMVERLNDFFAASYENGSMMTLAETYGVQAAMIAQ